MSIGRGLILALLLASPFPAVAREWVDSTGQFRIEAELVEFKQGVATLRKANGDLVKIPLDKLSAADQEHLKKLPATPAAASPFEPVGPMEKPGKPAAASDARQLAERAHAILESNCYRCHGQDGANEGGFNYVLNFGKLVSGGHYVVAGQPGESLLLERMTDKDADAAMPPAGESPRPTADEIATITKWIAAGAPARNQVVERPFVREEEMLAAIVADLRQTPERSRRFNRYFLLTHLHNAGISTDELATYRLALAKLVNSLSWNKRICLPQPIDKHETILRVDLRDLNWNERIWDGIVAADPYGVISSLPAARTCYEESQAEPPFVRADWFVAAASRPPLYHDILGIPETDEELERLLRIDAADNIDQEKVARAGFNRSGVSQNNRLIERHESPYGSYWKSYDFGGNTDRQNLFEYPMGPGNGLGHFRHDGGELIFSLPNGMQGYMLVDERGSRIDRGPTEIVSDPRQADKTVVNGISCMSCHYSGMITKSDEIRPFVEANRNQFAEAEDILAIYPEQQTLDELYRQDAERFLAALAEIKLTTLSRAGEPVSSMAMRFEESLDLTMAAAELGMKKEELAAILKASRDLPRVLGALNVPGGTIKRDAFGEIFGLVATDLGRGTSIGARGSRPATAAIGGNRLGADAGPRGRSTPSRISIKGAPETGEIRRFAGSSSPVHCVEFSPDGTRLAVGSLDRKVYVYDINTAEQRHLFEDHQGQVTAMAFLPDGKRLITADYNGKVLVRDLTTQGISSPVAQFIGHNGEVKCIRVSANGRLALSGSRDKRACLWDVATGKEVQTFAGCTRDVVAVHLSHDGRRVLVCDGDSLRAFDAAKGTQLTLFNIKCPVAQSASFSPDGRRLVCCDGYAIRMWDTGTGAELPKFEAASGDMQWTVAFSPDGRKLVSGANYHIIVWDVETRKRVELFEVEPYVYVQAAAFSPDNRHVASSIRGKTQVWRLRDK